MSRLAGLSANEMSVLEGVFWRPGGSAIACQAQGARPAGRGPKVSP
jgi:hypothetical protein